MKKKWEIFERECAAYLIGKYGPIFELKGKSDSTVSDILVNGKNEDNPFYIEVKMHPSRLNKRQGCLQPYNRKFWRELLRQNRWKLNHK